MPSLINTDSAGNVFYNYITPVIKGEATNYSSMFDTFFETKLGPAGVNWRSKGSSLNSYANYVIRLPAPGFEVKTGNISANDGNSRWGFAQDRLGWRYMNTNYTDTTAANNIGSGFTGSTFTNEPGSTTSAYGTSGFSFAVINDYAFCYATFADAALTSLRGFIYLGWCREAVYTGATSINGVLTVAGIPSSQYGVRPASAGSISRVLSSVAADTITSPPLVCTTETDPGDGSETFTDIVIRDAASPNNPVGKLWNCIDMPSTCNVGELWRNTGAYDADGGTSEQDVYLCVMPWGTRKLGMRVWTEVG